MEIGRIAEIDNSKINNLENSNYKKNESFEEVKDNTLFYTKNLEKVEKIVDAIRTTKGVKLLDYSSDKDHNRSVITFLGEPNAVAEAALKLAKAATELIDMSTHTGGHPRMGAVDVMPLIPIKDITIEETIELSKKLAESIANECNMHVTLYENSASAPHRQNLADIRRGQYEVMAEKIKEDMKNQLSYQELAETFENVEKQLTKEQMKDY